MRQIFHLYGRMLSSLAFDDATMEWVFAFEEDVTLRAAAPWRVVSDGVIAVGARDDGHQFGIGDPFDAVRQVRALIGDATVAKAWTSGPGDLHVQFGETLTLDVFNFSAGYEGWQLLGPGGRHVVALGGGRVHESESLE